MADGPTASETLGVIGVELYRLEVATESGIRGRANRLEMDGVVCVLGYRRFY